MIDLTGLDDGLIQAIEYLDIYRKVYTLDHLDQLFDKGIAAPSAFVLIGGWVLGDPDGSGYQSGHLETAVYTKARNVGGMGKARKDPNTGVYVLTQHLVNGLAGFKPLPCLELFPTSGKLWAIKNGTAIYENRFKAFISEDL